MRVCTSKTTHLSYREQYLPAHSESSYAFTHFPGANGARSQAHLSSASGSRGIGSGTRVPSRPGKGVNLILLSRSEACNLARVCMTLGPSQMSSPSVHPKSWASSTVLSGNRNLARTRIPALVAAFSLCQKYLRDSEKLKGREKNSVLNHPQEWEGS